MGGKRSAKEKKKERAPSHLAPTRAHTRRAHVRGVRGAWAGRAREVAALARRAATARPRAPCARARASPRGTGRWLHSEPPLLRAALGNNAHRVQTRSLVVGCGAVGMGVRRCPVGRAPARAEAGAPGFVSHAAANAPCAAAALLLPPTCSAAQDTYRASMYAPPQKEKERKEKKKKDKYREVDTDPPIRCPSVRPSARRRCALTCPHSTLQQSTHSLQRPPPSPTHRRYSLLLLLLPLPLSRRSNAL